MLKILNELDLFFNDCYRRINVREYARLKHISPPTASKLLQGFQKEGLLKKEIDKKYFYYYANKSSNIFKALAATYWIDILKEFWDYMENQINSPIIILFGSLTKAEAHPESDIDIAIFTKSKKEINCDKFEAKIGRTIQIFRFKSRKDIKNENLLNNILNGQKIRGNW